MHDLKEMLIKLQRFQDLAQKAKDLKSEYSNLTKEERISKIKELSEQSEWLMVKAKDYINDVAKNPDVKDIQEKATWAIEELKALAHEGIEKTTDVINDVKKST